MATELRIFAIISAAAFLFFVIRAGRRWLRDRRADHEQVIAWKRYEAKSKFGRAQAFRHHGPLDSRRHSYGPGEVRETPRPNR